jgi:hypothetical protein
MQNKRLRREVLQMVEFFWHSVGPGFNPLCDQIKQNRIKKTKVMNIQRRKLRVFKILILKAIL